ncbi:MAG: HD-GYP domain-containing protein [Cellulosilyticaceae bacterium]
MRLTYVHNLSGGELIGKDILTPDGAILLKANTTFREAFKDRLLDRGISEIYIKDNLSEGIEPPELISQNIKMKLNNHLQSQFESIQNVLSIDLEEIHTLTTTILENMSDQDIIFDMMDLKRNDNYTYAHCLNVSIISCALAKKMSFTFEMIEKVVAGALLHDIGKMVLPKDILNKPGKLTPHERAIMETHSTLGYDLIKENPTMSAISKVIILCHHEREDGNGYPLQKGADLHIASKIVAVADVFDALISDRPYRNGFPINEALLLLKQESLNTDIIAILEKMVAFYPVGCAVRLNTNEIALVEKNYSADLKKPSLRVIYDLNTLSPVNFKCSLMNDNNRFIVERLDDLPSSMLQ